MVPKPTKRPVPALRRAFQIGILLIFLVLFVTTTYRGGNEVNYPINVFFSVDPLAALSTALASRAISAFFWPSLLLVGATLLLGRFFCGWMCPLGATLDLARPLMKPRRTGWAPSKNLKYYVLAAIIAAALLSVDLAGVMDPLSIAVRSLTLVVYPLFSVVVSGALGALVRWDAPVVSGAADAVLTFLKATVLPFSQGHFALVGASLAVLVAIVALEKVRPRFWCRYLCPLGALLSVIAGVSFLKRRPTALCRRCEGCREVCETDAFSKDGTFEKGECILTLSCVAACPKERVVYSVGLRAGRTAPSLSRRWLVTSLVGGILAGPLLSITPTKKLEEGAGIARLIRPPGARDEPEFLARCVKCSECMMVCPTGGLMPDLGRGGIEGIYSPVLVPRIGYCEYHCTLCGQVCPTGAIRNLTESEKLSTVIGKATIDTSRCLPHAYGINCAVCQEHCPTADKAIKFVENRGELTVDGDQLKKPRVVYDLCVGCGICENKCPVIGDAAVVVTSMKEEL